MYEKEKLGNRLIGIGVVCLLLSGIGWINFLTYDGTVDFDIFIKLVFAGFNEWPEFPGAIAFFLATIRMPLLIIGVVGIIAGIVLKASASSSSGIALNPSFAKALGIILLVVGVVGIAACIAGLYCAIDPNTEYVYQAQWFMGGGSLTITDVMQDTYDGLLGWCIDNYRMALAVGGSLLMTGIAVLGMGGGKRGVASWMVTPDGQPWINTWVQHDGKSYYFNNSGNLLSSCWIEWNGAQYYICAEGYCTESRPVQG